MCCFLFSEHTPAVLEGYRLSFDIYAMPWVEPAFANVCKESGKEVHGVAFKMTVAAMKQLDRQEPYDKNYVTLKAYDNRDLDGFIYIKDFGRPDRPASKRYMGVLIKGAESAGLKPDYIEKLKQLPTYTPPDFVLKMRENRKALSEYEAVTIEELAKHKSEDDIW